MGAMPNEPSMEEILSSIKRIIAEEDGPAPRAPRKSAAARRVENGGADGGKAVEQGEPGLEPADDHVLELTDALPGEDAAEEEEPVMAAPTPTPAPAAKPKAEPKNGGARTRAAVVPPPAAASAGDPALVMSDAPAKAARESLIHLSQLLIQPEDGPSNTLEGLVREMLRPMLKEWLDARLPDMVEAMVKREIDRITGRV